jgi:hypothetical protein
MSADHHLKNLLANIDPINIFIEIGVLRGTTTVELSKYFKKTKFFGIDSYQPYRDDLSAPYTVSKEIANLNRSIAEQRFSKISATLLVEDSILAISHFNESSIDAVFLDAYMNEEQVIREVVAWYKMVRPGGLFCGHDAASPAVKQGLAQAVKISNITEQISFSPDEEVWYLIKQ